jgi:PelA/Pel-15E family pectate lyase
MVKLYDSQTKYKNIHINKSMNKSITVSFMIKISYELYGNFILICKNKIAELRIGLKKNGTLHLYYGDGKEYSSHIQTSKLESNKWIHIVFIRNMIINKNILYVNGVVESVTNQPYENVPSTKTELIINTQYSDQYEIKHIKIFNNTFGMKEPLIIWLTDMKSITNILEYLYNISTECLTFVNDGYTCIFNDTFFINFKENALLMYDEYIKFNSERNDKKLLPIIGNYHSMAISELNNKLNVFDIIKNIISWQFGMFQIEHPKDISNGENFWSLNEVSMFRPYTGNGLYSVSKDGTINDLRGTLQNGMCVSFIKLLVDYYVKNKDKDVLLSINKLVTYLLSAKYENNTIPLYTPQTPQINKCDDTIAISNGAFLNWLKICETILNNDDISQDIIQRTELLNAYTSVFNKLLSLQITIDTKLTIWAKYYDKTTLCPIDGNNHEPASLCSLESAQILLYLMQIEYPTDNIKNSIKSAGDWFIEHKINNYTQINEQKYDSDDTEQQILLKDYNYTFPLNSYLHARYYDLITQLPIFKDAIGDTLYTLGTFNMMSKEHRNTHTMIGTWGHYVINKYNEWKIIYC